MSPVNSALSLPPADPQAMIDELRQWVAREARGTRQELERSRVLVGDAVRQLQGSFRSMEEQSRRQHATVTELVERNGAGSPGIRQFAQSAGALIGELAQGLAASSREAVRTVQIIDEMAQSLDGIFDLLAGLKDLAEQTAQLATIAGARSGQPGEALGLVAAEARHLSDRTTHFCDRILALTRKATTAVGEVRTRVEDTAEREMNAGIDARTKADVLLERVALINHALGNSIGVVAGCGDRIRDDVSTAVRSLQFEDIVLQAMGAANVHLERLQALNQDAANLERLLAVTHGAPDRRARALEEFSAGWRGRREAFARMPHKPVSQVSMAAGELELF